MANGKVIKNIFKGHSFLKSLGVAARGIGFLFLYHRNMRVIFMLGVAAFMFGLYLNLRGIELVALCITITLVFMAEIFNTAIEMLMDIISEEHHVKIKLVKDIAAGIVVLACLNSVAVGYILFIRKLVK